jgi:hypothetical protein
MGQHSIAYKESIEDWSLGLRRSRKGVNIEHREREQGASRQEFSTYLAKLLEIGQAVFSQLATAV